MYWFSENRFLFSTLLDDGSEDRRPSYVIM